MKFSRNILFCVSIILVWKFCSAGLDDNFEKFKNKFSRNYQDLDEELDRKSQFEKADRRIFQHNKEYKEGKQSYKMKHNHFSDRFSYEKKKISMNVNNNIHTYHECNISQLPPPPPTTDSYSVNWLIKGEGYNTPVLYQGACDCGYAFATIGVIEAAYFRDYGENVKFSEQDIIDCSKHYGNRGCRSGYLSATFKYITKRGISLNENYPYIKKPNYECLESENKTKIRCYSSLYEQNENTIKYYVASYGPIAVSFNVNENFEYYSKGIYYDSKCDKNVKNHALIIVGYGRECGIDYWLVKNSFGKKWGRNGYAQIRRNVNQCGIANEAFLAHF